MLIRRVGGLILDLGRCKRPRLSREQRLLRIVRPYTMVDDMRLLQLNRLTRQLIAAEIPGDLVECGVCKGGSAAVLADAMKVSDRRLWLFDTFEGIPPAGPRDGQRAREYGDPLIGTVQNVEEVLRKVGFPGDRCVFREGAFERSYKDTLPVQVALLHIDADWYDSVLLSLQTFYPRLSDGGVVVLDDFGHWEGARRAFYAFCCEYGVEPLLERVGYTQAYWFKGREFNPA